MRFYAGAHEYLHKIRNTSDALDQCLYLVAEYDNQHDVNAVMLHNGKQKLGSVDANSAIKLKQMMHRWKQENRGGIEGEDVIVVRMDNFYMPLEDFKFKASIAVRGMQRVNERLARKFSNNNRKV